MIERLSPTARNVLLAALGLAVVLFAWKVRSVLNPLIAGYFVAYAVHPMVLRLERRGFSRAGAVNTIFFAFGLSVLVTLVGLGLQARRLVESLPQIVERAELGVDGFLAEHGEEIDWLLERLGGPPPAEPAGGEDEPAGDGPAPASEGAPEPAPGGEAPPGEGAGESAGGEAARPPSTWREVVERLGEELLAGEAAAEAGRVGLRAAAGGLGVFRRVSGAGFAAASFVFLLPIYTWFLLFELGRIHAFVRRYLPRRDRERLVRIGRQIGAVVANFFRGRLLVCLLKGLTTTLGLALAGVDYALLIGLSAGFLSLVPFVGPLAAALVAFLVAFFEHGFVYALVATSVVFVVAELVEGYVLIPKILGDSLGLHPVVVLLSVFVGGAAFGVFGMLVAIPVTAALVILARELVLPALAQFADEDGGPG